MPLFWPVLMRALLAGGGRRAAASTGKGVLRGLMGSRRSRKGVAARKKRLDNLQNLADAAGVADQSGAVDLANAGVSLFRGIRSKGKERREHFKDAGIRAFSAIPVVGDIAKVARAKKYHKALQGMQRTAPKSAPAVAASQKATVRAANPASNLSIPSTQQATRRGTVGGMLGALLSGGRARRSAPASGPVGNQPSPSGSTTAPGQPGAPAPGQRGLTPSEKLGMMGKSRDEIDQADNQKRAAQERQEAEEKAAEETERFKEKLKGMTRSIGGAIAGLIALPKATERFATALSDSRRDLTGYSGKLAASFARLDIQRVQLDMRTAQNTGSGSAALNQELVRLREELQPLSELGTDITNAAAIVAVKIGSFFADTIDDVATKLRIKLLIDELLSWLGVQKGKEDAMPIHLAVQEMIDKFDKQQPDARGPLPPIP